MASNASWFHKLAHDTSRAAGRPATFILALAVVVLWAATGPVFGYSNTWQLVINTGTTIITFLMVFLIQATQNRDTEEMQVKIDELIRATTGAHNALLDLEDMDEEQLIKLRQAYVNLANIARKAEKHGKVDAADIVDALEPTREDPSRGKGPR